MSKELLRKWLSSYKFKNWITTETRKLPVDQKMKEARADNIAEDLSDNSRWHSHGRGIGMKTLVEDINLKIEDYSQIKKLSSTIREYYELLLDYMNREKISMFVHTKEFF